MGRWEISLEYTFEVQPPDDEVAFIRCPGCYVQFLVFVWHFKALKRDSRLLYCPNGCEVEILEGDEMRMFAPANKPSVIPVENVKDSKHPRKQCRYCGDWKSATFIKDHEEKHCTLGPSCADRVPSVEDINVDPHCICKHCGGFYHTLGNHERHCSCNPNRVGHK